MSEKKYWTKALVACCVRIPEELHKLLIKKAKKDKVSKSFLIVSAVKDYLQNDQLK